MGLDRVLATLSNRRRRRILTSIQREGEVTVGELADGIGTDPTDTRSVLFHVDLPKLAKAGYVEWDREADTVSDGPAFGEVEPVLDFLNARADDCPGD